MLCSDIINIRSLQAMASVRPRRAKVKPKAEAAYYSSWSLDKDGFDVKHINALKGELPKYLFTCL